MSDLIEFLNARLDEDEQAAPRLSYEWWIDTTEECGDAILRFADKDRQRREIEAKRRIVELAGTYGCDQAHPQFDVHHPGGHDSPILKALALPYSDHPDFREEWRP